MKMPHVLLLALLLATMAHAQTTPPPPPPAAPETTPTPPSAPAETVQAAVPVVQLPSDKPPLFTREQVREIETKLKKQMMLVGMGGGVLGLLLGMMIGRKTAPRVTSRRF